MNQFITDCLNEMPYICVHKEKKVRKMKKLVIFDLDGTLLNTIADLAQSTNHALAALGYPTHEEQEYNFMVGNGINKRCRSENRPKSQTKHDTPSGVSCSSILTLFHM